MINILGICGSPVKDSNTELILKEALKTVEQDGVGTEIFTLDRLRCIHYGKYYAGGMKHKTGAAIAVGRYRKSGLLPKACWSLRRSSKKGAGIKNRH